MPDVVVVGGGIIGAACAYELARRGASVTLIERGELAAGASGRNHGLLLAPLDPLLGPMATASTELYEEIADETPLLFRLDPEPIGFLIVAGDDEEREASRAEAEAASACGVQVERIEGPDLFEIEPSLSRDLTEGWLLHDARRLDPAALTTSLALLARRHGAEVRRHLTVRSIDAGRVVTDDGSIDADEVVVAAGPWSTSLLRPLGVDLPVAAARGWLVNLAPSTPPTRRLIGRAGWHVLGMEHGLDQPAAGEVADSFPEATLGSLVQPNPDGTILAGGSRQAMITNEPEDPSVPRVILRGAIRLVPSLAEASVLSAWWGLRPMTPDDRPIVGEVADGVIVATGHGSQGVILGGGTGQLVASMVAGEPGPFDPGPFTPARFA